MEDFDALSVSGRQLKLFLAIYDSGSVSAAADRFGLNQSTVSHHLDRLRSALNDRLFIRMGKKIVPTEFAHELAPRVRHMVVGLEDLANRADFDPSAEMRTVTIAANVTELVPEMLRIRNRISRAAPGVGLRFLELGARSRVSELLDSGDVDLVITIRAAKYESSLNWQEYSRDRNVCFYDPQVRRPVRSIEEYCSARHAVLDFGLSGLSTVASVMAEQGLTREVALGASDVSLLAAMIPGTDLISTFQASLANSVFARLAYSVPPIDLPPVIFDLVWHRRSEHSGRSRWLRRTVLETASQPVEPVDPADNRSDQGAETVSAP
ncbi:MAG: LysR family transcriptional regulator [Pseudomonadota bacterium]